MGDVSKPYVLGLPYLPMSEPVEFCGWWLGPLDDFDGQWCSPKFEAMSRSFLASFRDAGGKPIEKSSLLVRSNGGADGVPPTHDEFTALQLALAFAAINQNDYWSPDTQHDTWRVATTDNADLWVQPLDLAGGWISLGRGARVSVTGGGMRVTDRDFLVPAPLELHLPVGVQLDAELLEATYQTLLAPDDAHAYRAATIRVALRWLLKSWQNTTSISWDDRLVFLKVATEALTGEDKNVDSAKRLGAIFAAALDQPGEGVGVDELLWSPDEPMVTRRWTTRGGETRSEEVSQFVHWCCALGDARNALVHGEDGTQHDYVLADSPYEGSFVEIADRVVREAICVLLGECGYPAVWRRGLTRASFRLWEKLTQEET
jgi:hypothetical protein